MKHDLPDFFNNPSLIELGPVQIQFYAVTWLLSAVLIYSFLKRNKIIHEIGLKKDDVNDMVFLYGLFFGAMCGGRIGYMLFYKTQELINDPVSLFKIWEGGLSFHGGLIGVIIALIIFCKKKNIKFLRLMDGVALSMPIGLGLVRIGNFLNGELYGKATTNQNWGLRFIPTDPECKSKIIDSIEIIDATKCLYRHPSQLYESFGEGILLFAILLFISQKTNIKGVVCSSFLIFYGSIRFIIEFFRQPDSHIGYVAYDSLSMGQLLCIPMIIVGFFILIYSRKNA